MNELKSNQTVGAEPLIDVDGLSRALIVPKSWIYGKTRQNLIPCVKVGKYYRFYLSEVLTSLKDRQAERLSG